MASSHPESDIDMPFRNLASDCYTALQTHLLTPSGQSASVCLGKDVWDPVKCRDLRQPILADLLLCQYWQLDTLEQLPGAWTSESRCKSCWRKTPYNFPVLLTFQHGKTGTQQPKPFKATRIGPRNLKRCVPTLACVTRGTGQRAAAVTGHVLLH